MRYILSIPLCALLLISCANKNVPNEKEPSIQMTGAYTDSRKISKEEQKLFRETYKGDIPLTPVAVSTQVVAGTNYMYTCKDKNGNKYKVVIYQKLSCYGGEAEVTSVEQLR